MRFTRLLRCSMKSVSDYICVGKQFTLQMKISTRNASHAGSAQLLYLGSRLP
jgi:hypothetical protein